MYLFLNGAYGNSAISSLNVRGSCKLFITATPEEKNVETRREMQDMCHTVMTLKVE